MYGSIIWKETGSIITVKMVCALFTLFKELKSKFDIYYLN